MVKAADIKKILDEKITEADALFADHENILETIHRLKPRADDLIALGDKLVRIILERRWPEVGAAQNKFSVSRDEISTQIP